MRHFLFNTAYTFILILSLSVNGADSTLRKGKAVYEISQQWGMKINSAGLQNMGLETLRLKGVNEFEVPQSSLIYYQNNIGIFRRREGWIKRIPIQMVRKLNSTCIINTSELKENDEVVTSGSALLRVAELDAFSEEE